MTIKRWVFVACALGVAGCQRFIPLPPEPSPGHLGDAAKSTANAGDIPGVVEQTPYLPPPQALPESEKYTVVVNEVPVKELLFAVARDARVNVDIDPRIDGVVTLNAVEQTLPQILDRITRQLDVRYEIRDKTVLVMPDEPYLRTYKVDYVNMQRDTKDTISVATQIATTGSGNVTSGGGSGSGGQSAGGGTGGGGGAGGGLNNSTTTVTSTSNQRFWVTLTQNIRGIIGSSEGAASGATATDNLSNEDLIVSPESGLVTVRATAKQHAQIQTFLDQAMANVQRQVLIEATVVEVELNDRFQAGIDWEFARDVAAGAGFGGSLQLLQQSFRDGTSSPNTGVLRFINPGDSGINAALKLLNNFGDTKVLSSPRMMVLNNQTAVLKVVENVVYFSTEVKVGAVVSGGIQDGLGQVAIDTNAETVPVGLVMTVTPQVNENDSVILNVRPTISDVVKFVNDPNPAFVTAGFIPGTTTALQNPVPQIRVREMESMLKVNSGQIAVLGGLIQDRVDKDTNSIPILREIPLIGDTLFKGRTNQFRKSELVVFLRPIVVNNPSVDGELKEYQPFLERRPDVPLPK